MILRNPRLTLIGIVASVSAVAIGLVSIDRLRIGQQLERQAETNCVAIESMKAAITDVLEDGRARVVLQRGALDRAAYLETLAYYDRQLARFKPKEC